MSDQFWKLAAHYLNKYDEMLKLEQDHYPAVPRSAHAPGRSRDRLARPRQRNSVRARDAPPPVGLDVCAASFMLLSSAPAADIGAGRSAESVPRMR
jgi:hypothetical protein